MIVQSSLIWELMLFEFEQGQNSAETMKKICYVKGKRHSWSQYSNEMVQEILIGLNKTWRSGKIR